MTIILEGDKEFAGESIGGITNNVEFGVELWKFGCQRTVFKDPGIVAGPRPSSKNVHEHKVLTAGHLQLHAWHPVSVDVGVPEVARPRNLYMCAVNCSNHSWEIAPVTR